MNSTVDCSHFSDWEFCASDPWRFPFKSRANLFEEWPHDPLPNNEIARDNSQLKHYSREIFPVQHNGKAHDHQRRIDKNHQRDVATSLLEGHGMGLPRRGIGGPSDRIGR
jgi:hypothetical protein